MRGVENEGTDGAGVSCSKGVPGSRSACGIRGCGVGLQEAPPGPARAGRQGRARRRPRVLQLVGVHGAEADQGVREAVRRQGPRVELRLDAGHDGQAPLGQPLRRDLPHRGVGRPPAQGQPAHAHRRRAAPQRRVGLRLLRRALVRPRGRLHAPVRDVRQRDHLPRRQDQRHDGLVERHGQPVGRRPRLPARRLPGGHRRRQPRQRRRPELDRPGRRGGRQGVGARPEAEAARLLDGRHPEHGLRQRVDPPRLERRRGEHPQPGRQRRRTSRSRSAPRGSRSAPTASRSPPTPSTPARR